MPTLPAGSITVHRLGRSGGYGGPDTLVCTTCGCVVASEYATRHIAWHVTGAWVPAAITADATVTSPLSGGLPLGT